MPLCTNLDHSAECYIVNLYSPVLCMPRQEIPLGLVLHLSRFPSGHANITTDLQVSHLWMLALRHSILQLKDQVLSTALDAITSGPDDQAISRFGHHG